MGIKKVAILCNYKLIPERIGGMDYFFIEFDRFLKQHNHVVTWVFPNNANHFSYSELNIISAGENSIENSFILHLRESKISYDYVYCHFLELCTPFFGQLNSILPLAQIIAIDHNPRPAAGYSLKKKISKRIKGIYYSKYIQHFVSVSEQAKLDLIKDFGYRIKNKTRVIYNGLRVDEIQTKLLSTSNKFTFLVASHLRKEKGIEDLLEAISKLSPTVKEQITIDIYGEGNLKELIEQRIKTFNLSETIHLKGSKPSLYHTYCHYDYLIHPSHAETFCYSVVESVLANIPVITTINAGNILELVKNEQNGYLFKIGDVSKLSEIISHIVLINSKLIIETRNEIKAQFSLQTCIQNHYSYIQ